LKKKEKIKQLRQKLKELRDKVWEKINKEGTLAGYSETDLRELRPGSLENASDEDIDKMPAEILELWDELEKAEIIGSEDQAKWIDRIDAVLGKHESPVNLRELFGNMMAKRELELLDMNK